MTLTYVQTGFAQKTVPNGCLTVTSPYTLDVSPVPFSDIGTYLITATITDNLDTVSTTFKISVSNSPPYFTSEVPADFTMSFNSTYTFTIPPYIDDEGHTVSMIL